MIDMKKSPFKCFYVARNVNEISFNEILLSTYGQHEFYTLRTI